MNRSVVAVVVAGLLGAVIGAAAYALLGPGSATLDPALSQLLTVTVAAGIGFGGAVVGAGIAARESKANRDDARSARAAEREDAQADRFAERKVALAVDLLIAADVHQRQTAQRVATVAERWADEMEYGGTNDSYGPLPVIDTTEPVRAAMLALTLVAPSVDAAAGELYMATVALGPMAIAWPYPNRDQTGHDDWAREWTAATGRWEDARWMFVDRVRADLGVSRPPKA